MTPLVAILGAGASRGSGNYPSRTMGSTLGILPPLTVDLFDEDLYSQVLSKYDLAHQAGRFITQELSRDDTLGLEHALHGLATSEFPHHQHYAKAVPPYLQHLLYQVSDERYTEALHYDRLIERLLGLPYVFFVSLNYDVLLDRRLNGHYPLSDLRAYIDNGRNWSLIKPHGSVNWYHVAREAYPPAAPPLDLSWDHQTFRCDPPNESLDVLRGGGLRRLGSESTELTERYPALAMPEGPDDRLVLPREHEQWFGHQLYSAREIDILVIGYSGLDRAVLDFIAGAGCKVRRMTVVSHNAEMAAEVLERFRATRIDPLHPNLVDGDFASWSNDGGLNLLVDEYDGPYHD
jgi:hypothetical protein